MPDGKKPAIPPPFLRDSIIKIPQLKLDNHLLIILVYARNAFSKMKIPAHAGIHLRESCLETTKQNDTRRQPERMGADQHPVDWLRYGSKVSNPLVPSDRTYPVIGQII